MEEVVKLDDLDKTLLNILQEDATIAYKELSKMVNAPESTVYDRVKRLRSLGVIKGIIPLLDAKKCGKMTTAFIRVTIEKIAEIYRIAREIAKFDEVLEVHIISSEWDLLVKVKVEDNGELLKFEIDKMGQIEGIAGLYSIICIGTEKEDIRIRI
ncbi:MAG: Lrp/AsnC family transcriptional regulator [Candidatus Methanofastidiosia archaeon]